MRRPVEHPAFHPLPSGFIPLPTDPECAWLAGMIDGEGTIALSVLRKTGRVTPRVSITNTNLDNIGRARVLIRALIDHDVLPTVSRSEYRPCYQVPLTARDDVVIVLKAVRQWLVGKRAHADLMLEYLAEFPGRGRQAVIAFHRQSILAPERRRVFVAQMRELNRRYPKGEWSRLHPETIDRRSLSSSWREGERAEFLGDSWDSIKALMKLRCG